VAAIRYAREQKMPFLGICLGLQIAIIEYARSVLGILFLRARLWSRF